MEHHQLAKRTNNIGCTVVWLSLLTIVSVWLPVLLN